MDSCTVNYDIFKTDCVRTYKLLCRVQVVAWSNLASAISDNPFLGNLACFGIWWLCAPALIVTAAIIPVLCLFNRWNGFVISMAAIIESSNIIAQRYLEMQRHLGGRMTISFLVQIFSIVTAFLNMLYGIARSVYDFGKFYCIKTRDGGKWIWNKVKSWFD